MDTGTLERDYLYRGRTPWLIVAITWAAMAAALAWATLDHRPFHGADGRVTTGEGTASIIRWGVFLIATLFAVFSTRWAWIDAYYPRRLTITTRGVIAPRIRWGWYATECFLPYDAITECSAMVVHHLGASSAVTRLRLRGPEGRVTINRDHLPIGVFDEICAIIATRIDGGRARHSSKSHEVHQS